MRTRNSRIRFTAVALVMGVSVTTSCWAQERTGQEVYESFCKLCHQSGLAGAPVKGDQEWVQRVTNKGMDALLASVVEGLNAMPPQGGCSDCTQSEFINAIQYMLPKNMPM
ncbi:MAG: c-type cytochrome [Gammaproteobacteria bacterium]